MTSDEPRPFSLTAGGPFYRLLQRLKLLRQGGGVRAAWLAAFAWVPMLILEGLRARGRPVDPTFLDLSVHMRLAVALPAMFAAERIVEPAARSAIASLYRGAFCPRGELDRIVAFGERWRDAVWPEAVMAVASLAWGQLVLWQITGPTGLFHGGANPVAALAPTRTWYAAVALPLAMFVMFRWLWRWLIWSVMLARLAAVRLELLCTHPDHAAGLSCLARPMSGFAGFSFAMGAVLAGAWGTQVVNGLTTPQAQLPGLLAFLLVIAALSTVPLLLFCGQLFRARRKTLAEYGDFANEYVRGFHARWIVGHPGGGSALGAADLQALNDLGGAFGVVSRTRLFAFGLRQLLSVWFGALLPMLPLFASQMSVEDVLKRLLSAVLGGMPL